MYIFKQVFRIRMIFVLLSSELYIKDKHSNGVKFSNGIRLKCANVCYNIY